MDFQQGLITTVHDYGVSGGDPAIFHQQLRDRPTALLLPCLMEEFRRPALRVIREVLSGMEGLQSLVIALAADSVEEVLEAEAFWVEMPFPVHVHWTNGPAVIELLQSVKSLGLDVLGPPGKGWAVWQGLGVACQTADVVGLFDADIRTFTSAYPRRMLQPLLDRSMGVAYVKAFYSRLSLETHALQGRATRLFVAPLLSGLEQIMGPLPYLRYLQSFRYPLAGEFAFSTDLAMNLSIPCDWGLEIGLLTEVYRHVAISRIAQVDLGVFDHKHKVLGNAPDQGLKRMASEILRTVLRGLMEHEGRNLLSEQLPTLEALFRRLGQDRVRQFGLDSAINGLPYDRHGEELAVQEFAQLLRPAVKDLIETPSAQQLPSWSRVLSCSQDLQQALASAGQCRSATALGRNADGLEWRNETRAAIQPTPMVLSL